MADGSDTARFIAIIEEWNAAGWGEYLLWETVEGTRDQPFPFLELPEEDRAVCRRLRDEQELWVFWDETGACWTTTTIRAWRKHVAKTSAKKIRDALGGT